MAGIKKEEMIQETKQPEGMTISKMCDMGIIKDSTNIIIRNELFGVLTAGNWYMDSILEYMDKAIESFTWQDDGKIYVDLKEVEE